MTIVRRWSVRIVGMYSNRQIGLDFCRFFSRRRAEAYARKLDALEPADERVTKVEAYYRPWRPAEWWACAAWVVVVLGCLVALTLIFVREPPAPPTTTTTYTVLTDPAHSHLPETTR